MATRTLSVVITGDPSGARRAFSQTDAAAGQTESKLSKIGSKLAGLGQAATLALGAGVSAFGSFAISQALAGEQAHARLVNAMKNAGPAFSDLEKRAEAVTGKFADWGFQNDEVEVSLAKLAPVTKNSKDATDKLALAADIARARHISLEDATALLVKVQTGHVGLLGRLGIATKDATGKTISQEEAIKRLSQMYGGQANRSANTLSGQMEALKAKFANFAEEVGQKVIPIVSAVIDWFGKHKEVAIALAAIIGGGLLVAIGAYIASMITAAAATVAATWPILAIVAAIGAVVAAAYFLWTNWDQVWNWIKNHPAIAAVVAILFAPIAMFVLIVGALKWLYDNWDTIWSAIQQIAQIAWDSVLAPVFAAIGWGLAAIGSVLGALRDVWNAIWPIISSTANAAWQNVIQPVLAGIGWGIAAIGSILGTMRDVWNGVWGGLGGALAAGWSVVEPILQGIYDILSNIVSIAHRAARAIADVANANIPGLGGGGPLQFIPGLGPFGNSLGLPGFADGGPVPGPVGAPQLAVVHGGEFVVPAGGALVAGSSGDVGTLVIPVQIDGRTVTELVVRNINTPGGPQIAQRAIADR